MVGLENCAVHAAGAIIWFIAVAFPFVSSLATLVAQ